MNNLRVLGKFLDQPILVSKFQKKVPAILAGATLGYTAYNTKKAQKGHKKETAIKTGLTLGLTAASAVAAPHIASKITKRALPSTLEKIKQNNKILVDTFIKNNDVKEKTLRILKKSENKILSFNEVKTVFSELKDSKKGKEFLEKLIPSPENITAKDIFSEIGYLSIFGAVPVLGGIIGGIVSDRITDKNNWKDKIPNKIKEGSYQYLANIFMCNVGAGGALAIMEKLGIQSKGARALGMTTGIILTGIIGGSKIANFIGDKIIDPIFSPKQKKVKTTNILEEKMIRIQEKAERKERKRQKQRTPEVLDIGLHTDDIATVSLLSGLKWIEPALPVMYTLSGYRAGIGYRN